MILTNSETQDFKKCRLLWDFRWVQGLERITKTPELDKGSLIHQCLQFYYEQLVAYRDSWCLPERFKVLFKEKIETYERELLARGLLDELNELKPRWSKVYREGVSVLEGYHDRWQDTFETVLIEQRLVADIAPTLSLSFKPDLVFREAGSLWLMEHKSGRTASLTTYTIDSQSALYIGGLRLLGYDVVGCVYNLLGDKLSRYKIIRTGEVAFAMDNFQKVAKDMENPAIYDNWDWQCYSRCPYRELCIMKHQGYETTEHTLFIKKVKDD